MIQKTSCLRWMAVLLVLFVAKSEQYGSGGTTRNCQTMMPSHADNKPDESPSPYQLIVSTSEIEQGTSLNLTIKSKCCHSLFNGYYLQARSVNDPEVILGSWFDLPLGSKPLKCSADRDTVTQSKAENIDEITFSWIAPRDFSGPAVFRATVTQSYSVFWINVDSSIVDVIETNSTTESNPTTTISSTTTDSTLIGSFYDECTSSKKLCFPSKSGCIQNQNCELVASTVIEDGVYTFELLGKSEGYIGVALSVDKYMGDDSFMECINENGKVASYNSWTYPKVKPWLTRENVSQEITQFIKSSIIDDNIYCKFTRVNKSIIRGTEYDLTLNTHHLMLVSGSSFSDDIVGYHDYVCVTSKDKVPLNVNGIINMDDVASTILKIHGILMYIAWIGTTSCGIILARYYRQTWVGTKVGGKDIWFAWHNIFMMITWILTIAAFIMVLSDGWDGTVDNPHAILGIITVVLCVLQPIGACLRPLPNSTNRPIFNWLHMAFGNIIHLLSIITMFYAVYLRKAELPEWVVYILTAFVVFYVIVNIVLSVEAHITKGETKKKLPGQKKRTDAPHSPFRKFIIGLFFTVIIIFTVTLICITALAPLE